MTRYLVVIEVYAVHPPVLGGLVRVPTLEAGSRRRPSWRTGLIVRAAKETAEFDALRAQSDERVRTRMDAAAGGTMSDLDLGELERKR